MRIAILSALLLATLCTSADARAQSVQQRRHSDSRVEADYLLRFAEFTEWPSSPRHTSDRSISFCILGKDPYGQLLDRSLLGHLVGKRHTIIVRGRRLEDLGHCDVLFISPSKEQNEQAILRKLQHSSVLTVGDDPDFAARGGMIQFTTVHGRVGFVVNVSAVRRAGLKIDAPLLALAAVVYDQPTSKGRA